MFAEAATSYMQSGKEARFLAPVIKHFGFTAAEDIDQSTLDAAAAEIYPDAAPATRNRQVYTPVLAVLKHVGIERRFRRPKGALGEARTLFLSPDQIERIAAAAHAIDPEFAIFAAFLCYTGLRLSEALRATCDGVDLSAATAVVGKTKNGLPRAVHLPPRLVADLAAHPRGLDRSGERLFKWAKSGALYSLSRRVFKAAGVDHGGAPHHIFRHTYGALMTRAGADLVATGAWKSPAAARGYSHFATSEEARKADRLPGAGTRAVNGQKKSRNAKR